MMADLLKLTGESSLPHSPTASDTADWYRLGDAVEKHGRHMKRQAGAAEYISGRNMAEWSREVGASEGVIRDLLTECRTVGLIDEKPRTCTRVPDEALSQALPTARAAREYAKAEPEVREVIKEIIKEDPNAEIKAAEIKKLRDQVAALNDQAQMLAYEANEGRVAANQRDKLREQLESLTQDTSTKDLEEARQELDALYTSILTVSRNINKLSTKVFTHNDPHFINKVQQALTSVVQDFSDRAAQVILDPSDSIPCDSSGAAGGEVRVLDITYVH
jgi:hypothetical protein